MLIVYLRFSARPDSKRSPTRSGSCWRGRLSAALGVLCSPDCIFSLQVPEPPGGGINASIPGAETVAAMVALMVWWAPCFRSAPGRGPAVCPRRSVGWLAPMRRVVGWHEAGAHWLLSFSVASAPSLRRGPPPRILRLRPGFRTVQSSEDSTNSISVPARSRG